MKALTVFGVLYILNTGVAMADIDGAYERVSLVNTRSGESPEAANRVGLLLFGSGHYAMTSMNPDRRALSRDDAKSLPADDKIRYLEEWLDINAHSGRYELDGDTLLWHREFSEDPREVGSTTSLRWRSDGDLLVLTFTLGNGDRYDWTWRRRSTLDPVPDSIPK